MDEQPYRRGRGPGKRPAMAHITIRIPQRVVDYYDRDLIKMRNAWVEKLSQSIEVIDTV
jgi:hypothetical protein